MSVLYLAWEPVLHVRWAVWLITLVLVGADIVLALWFGARSLPFLAVNNLVPVGMVIGITNLWAQSGMQARAVALPARTLTLYDIIFTAQLSLMRNLFSQLAGLPFVPMLTWHLGDAQDWPRA